MRHQLVKYLSLLSLLVGLSTGSQATTYTFTSVDVSGASDTFTNGINDNGEIVGSFDDATGFHGFVRPPGGNIQTFHINSGDIFGIGINNSGDIVGSVRISDVEHPYLSNTGNILPGGLIGATVFPDQGTALGINGGREFVGSLSAFHDGFLRFPSNVGVPAGGAKFDIAFLDFPGAVFTEGNGINNEKTIVGNYGQQSGVPLHSFRAFGDPSSPSFNGFHYQTVPDVPGSSRTLASGINDAGFGLGQIVGQYKGPVFAPFCTPNGICNEVQVGVADQGFLLDTDGSVATINVPLKNANPLILGGGTDVKGINNRGQLVGDFVDTDGFFHGFLANPVSDSQKGALSFCLSHPLVCHVFPEIPLPPLFPNDPPPEGIQPIECNTFLSLCAQINEITGLLLENPGTDPAFFLLDTSAAPVPEPSTWLLLGSGLAGLVIWRRYTAKPGQGHGCYP